MNVFILFTSVLICSNLIQAETSPCVRTNPRPKDNCARACNHDNRCGRKGQVCVCDGDCGLSCVKPTRKCGNLEKRVANGRVTYPSNNFNATYKVVCKKGYTLVGSPVRRCRGNGLWDGRRTKCKIRCADPGLSPYLRRHSKLRKTGFSIGAQLRHYCLMNYVVNGDAVITCGRNGQWSNTIPTCQPPKACPMAKLPANSYVKLPQQWQQHRQYGVRYILGCESGYYGGTMRPLLVCMTSLWGKTASWHLHPKQWHCKRKNCGSPGVLRYGQQRGTFLFGDRVNYTCNQCYKLHGVTFQTCQANRKWTQTQPTCQPAQCSTPNHPPNGQVHVTSLKCRGKAQYTCNHGYTLHGVSIRTCLSSEQWSNKEPFCIKISTTTRTTPVSTRITEQSRLIHKRPTSAIARTMTMVPSKPMINQPPSFKSTITNKQLSKLVALCGVFKIPANGNNNNVRVMNSGFVRIRCLPQFTLKRLGLMVCKNGSWLTYQKLDCGIRHCKNPGVPKNGNKHGLLYSAGTTVTFSCNQCFYLAGKPQITCLSNGTWDGPLPQCNAVKCADDLNTTDVKTVYSKHSCVASHSCQHSNMELRGSQRRTCGSDGQWSGQIPTCAVKNLALNKVTRQSSVDKDWPGPASRAVDGDRNPVYVKQSSCTHTKKEYGPWWMVDLGQQESVAMVVVVNRGGHNGWCCYDRLNGFQVLVGDDTSDGGRNNVLCGRRNTTSNGEVITIKCPRTLKGRYVSVVLPKHKRRIKILTLCEVEVYSTYYI